MPSRSVTEPVRGADLALREHLRAKYSGVLDDAQVDRHIEDYVGLGIARELVEQIAPRVPSGARILDLGSGFGSFVLAARLRGFDAIGVEIEPFEVAFARRRLRSERAKEDPEQVYLLSSANGLAFPDASFDAVTLWNVLEHVVDLRGLLGETARVLRPGGMLFLICPNYAAFRTEPHYFVLWPSLLPRGLASAYLRLRGRKPDFFETSIHYRTNREVLGALRRLGFQVADPRQDRIDNPSSIRNPRLRRAMLAAARTGLLPFVRLALRLSFENPFRATVLVRAEKPR
jgi:MPBQ/MSBQ methyltransferase